MRGRAASPRCWSTFPRVGRVALAIAATAVAAGTLASSASAQTLGALTPLNCFSTTAVTGCTSQPGLDADPGLSDNVAVSPDGRNAYAVMSRSTVVQFAIQPDGTLAYVSCIGDATLAGLNPCPVAAPGIKQGNGGTGGVVVSPDGANVYVAGHDSDTVAVFRREPAGPTLGRLTSEGCLATNGVTTCDAVPGTTHGQVPGLDGPLRLSISPDGSNVYVPAISSATVAVLKRDMDGPAPGRLSGGGCLANVGVTTCNGVTGGTSGQVPGLQVPAAVTVSPDGATVYVTDAFKAIAVLSRDLAGTTPGRLTSDGCIADLGTTKCDGVAGSTQGQAPGLTNPAQAVVSPDGKNVYVGGQSTTAVFKRDGGGPTPGRLTSDGCLATPGITVCDNVAGSTKGRALGASNSGIAVAPDGANVYTAAVGNALVAAFKREADGALVFDGCLANTGVTSCDSVAGATHGQAAGLERPRGVAVAPNGQSLYVANALPGSVTAFGRFVPAPPATPTPNPPTFEGVRLANRTIRINARGRAALTLRCPGAAQGACAGRGMIKTARRIRLGTRRKRIRTLARFSFSAIPPGATKKVRFRVSRKVRRLIFKRRRLQAVVSTTAHDSRNINRRTRTTVTLKPRRKR